MGHSSFIEIEHKFIVPNGYDRSQFLKIAQGLSASRIEEISVKDTYYVLNGRSSHVFRHRFDQEIQQLTVKSVGSSTFERLEVNLDLLGDGVDQTANIQAFLNVFGIAWKATLTKDIGVAYFDDCEVVHYRAAAGKRAIECVEFEAIGFSNGPEALPTLHHYEKSFGLSACPAENQSLFHLLLLVDAPPEIKQLFAK